MKKKLIYLLALCAILFVALIYPIKIKREYIHEKRSVYVG